MLSVLIQGIADLAHGLYRAFTEQLQQMIVITVFPSCNLVVILWQEGGDQIQTGFPTAELANFIYLFIYFS